MYQYGQLMEILFVIDYEKQRVNWFGYSTGKSFIS